MDYVWETLSNKESCTAALNLETSNKVRPKVLNLIAVFLHRAKICFCNVTFIKLLATKLSAILTFKK
jgi:hypothetical protein